MTSSVPATKIVALSRYDATLVYGMPWQISSTKNRQSELPAVAASCFSLELSAVAYVRWEIEDASPPCQYTSPLQSGCTAAMAPQTKARSGKARVDEPY